MESRVSKSHDFTDPCPPQFKAKVCGAAQPPCSLIVYVQLTRETVVVDVTQEGTSKKRPAKPKLGPDASGGMQRVARTPLRNYLKTPLLTDHHP